MAFRSLTATVAPHGTWPPGIACCYGRAPLRRTRGRAWIRSFPTPSSSVSFHRAVAPVLPPRRHVLVPASTHAHVDNPRCPLFVCRAHDPISVVQAPHLWTPESAPLSLRLRPAPPCIYVPTHLSGCQFSGSKTPAFLCVRLAPPLFTAIVASRRPCSCAHVPEPRRVITSAKVVK